MQNSKCDRTCIHADPTPWESVRIICDRDMCVRSEQSECPYKISLHKRNDDFVKDLERYIRETTTVKINPDTPTSVIFCYMNEDGKFDQKGSDMKTNKVNPFSVCGSCPHNDGTVYTTDPPKVMCSIDGSYHFFSDKCTIESNHEQKGSASMESNKEIDSGINIGIEKALHEIQKGQKETMLESNTERHKRVCYELNRIYDQKNHDYGDSFHESWKNYGITMAAIRIGDKYNRLRNLTSKNGVFQNVANESLRDTLLDLANYAIMTVMEMDAENGKPFPACEWVKEERGE